VLPRGTVFEAAASRGIDADHAADGRDRAGGRIGGEDSTASPQMGVQPFVNDSCLHADRVASGAHDAAKVFREIDDDPRSDGSPGDARAGAAGVDGDLLLLGILQAGGDVGRGARADHRQGLDLIDAGVAGVELEEVGVAADFSGDQAPQIRLESFTLLVQLIHRVRIG